LILAIWVIEESAGMYDTVENRPTRAADSRGCLKKHGRKLTVLKGVNTFGELNICVWLERNDPKNAVDFVQNKTATIPDVIHTCTCLRYQYAITSSAGINH